MSLSDPASLPAGFKSYTVGCTLLMESLPSKDVVWSVAKFEVQVPKGTMSISDLEINFTKLVIITIDKKGRATKHECRLDRNFFAVPHFN